MTPPRTEILGRLREKVARGEPIIGGGAGTGISAKCEAAAGIDLIVIYKEYPHVDPGLRAKELFALAVDTKLGNIKPTMALFDCHMIGFYYTPYEPMRSFIDEMMAAEGKEGVLSLSLAHCFPWGDVPDCGARMLTITDNNLAQAQAVAAAWGRRFYNMRHTATARSRLNPSRRRSTVQASRDRAAPMASASSSRAGSARVANSGANISKVRSRS